MRKKILAAFLSAATFVSVLPFSQAVSAAEPQAEVIYSADFEDGINDFTGRGGCESFNIISPGANGSGNCLECSDREKNWHGPCIALDDMLEQGVEYIAGAWVKAVWHNNITMTLDYTDSAGERHYVNLKSAVSTGDWVEIEPTKFSIPKNSTNTYLYFECNDGSDLYVDDFVITAAPLYEIEKDIPSLKNVYADYFKFGTAATTSELAPKSAQSLIKKHFNSITPGNELKPDAILDKNACLALAAEGDDTNPQVSIASAREILDFARDNKLSVRGHVLVWHSQTPDWFFKENYADDGDWVSKEKMLKRMENYIKNVFAAIEEEYPTVDFYAWDVVNEAWLDDGQPRKPGEQGANGSNNSAWVQVFGDNSFIEPAFEYARKYAPKGCKLYYNDFNEYMPQKTPVIVEMANDLKAKGLIDGIGMQSHLDVRDGTDENGNNNVFPALNVYEKAMKAFVETGLDVQVTELDATVNGNSDKLFKDQAEYYKGILEICRKYSDNISAVVLWGTTDDKSWRASRYPLVFNGDFTAKPSFYAILEGMDIPEPEPDYNEELNTYLLGDVNGDEIVNVFDVMKMRKIYLYDYVQYIAPEIASPLDADGDAKFRLNDIVLLSQFIVGEDVELKYHDWDSWPAP